MTRRQFLALSLFATFAAIGDAVLARVLLRTASYPAPIPFVLTASPHGGQTSDVDPRWLYIGGKTVFGLVNSSSGDVEAYQYDHAAKTTSNPFAIQSALSQDLHATPTFCRRVSDGKLIVIWSDHDGPGVGQRISTNPDDATAWGSLVAINGQLGGTADYTYMNLLQLVDVSGDPMWLFWREWTGTGFFVFSKSTDDAATWATRTRLLTSSTAGEANYVRLGWTGSRIDVFFTDRDPRTGSLYHLYIDGTTGKRYKTDGTEITASLPLKGSDATLVLSNSAGAVMPMGASYDSSGRPAVAAMQAQGGTDVLMNVIRWNGSAWTSTTVAHGNHVLATSGDPHGSTSAYWASGMAIDHANPNVVYCPVYNGTHWEMWRYRSLDDGATWSGINLTPGATADHIMPEVPLDRGPGLAVAWAVGSYTTFVGGDYSLGFMGLAA